MHWSTAVPLLAVWGSLFFVLGAWWATRGDAKQDARQFELLSTMERVNRPVAVFVLFQ